MDAFLNRVGTEGALTSTVSEGLFVDCNRAFFVLGDDVTNDGDVVCVCGIVCFFAARRRLVSMCIGYVRVFTAAVVDVIMHFCSRPCLLCVFLCCLSSFC